MTQCLANWPAPQGIHAFTTTKKHGISLGAYASNNLALHVHDDPNDVCANRQALLHALDIPGDPAWLDQTHSTLCVHVEQETNRQADAAITRQINQPLVILTADCLPILLCSRNGVELAAIHAGWRGLANGVIENTLARMCSATDQLMAWIGPGICKSCYQVGRETRAQIIDYNPSLIDDFILRDGFFYADLSAMATRILTSHGISSVHSANACTFEEKALFYSYRQAPVTGRMATFIWQSM